MSGSLRHIRKEDVVLITREDLEDLIQKAAANRRDNLRRGLMTYEEAREALGGIDDSVLRKLLRSPETMLRRSNIRGRILADSVYLEAQRLSPIPRNG